MTKRVVLIEDHPMNVDLVTDLLEIGGYAVLSAREARCGLELVRREKPAFVLMDIGLPDMDGLTATGLLKKDPSTRHIPVIALTAHAMKDDEQKALAAGCDGYITKPIDTRRFFAQVAEFAAANCTAFTVQ